MKIKIQKLHENAVTQTGNTLQRNPSSTKLCIHCGKEFTVPFARRDTAKFCSRLCSDSHPRKHNEVQCRECGKLFPMKESQSQRNNRMGNFCSSQCNSNARSRLYSGDKNPNWKGGRNFDSDGYAIYSDVASRKLGLGTLKVHQANVLIHLGLKKIPQRMHVHHRDCDRTNNDIDNLQLINASDHKWIHHQFGVATLRAIQSGLLDVAEAASWSDDVIRATGILMQNIESQRLLMNLLSTDSRIPNIATIAALKPIRVDFETVEQLALTERGVGGFGSSGNA